MTTIIRIHDGYAWTWESDGENLRIVRGKKVGCDIEDYAERLVNHIKGESK